MSYGTFSEYLCDHAADEGEGSLLDGTPLSEDIPYASPVLTDLGHVRDVTLGSSPNGNADANSQYYW